MFTNKETQQVPNTIFPIITPDGWASRNSDDIFANKTVIVFSLPGAFTPTCSSSHLPRYNELAKKFAA
ncbi:MAG: peroxiredoxin, partial [Colwellia sp.]